jgi:outer membrane protein assembly factor BamD (BamD/ComL family)
MGDAKRAGVVLAAIKHLPLGDEKLKSYLTARLLLSENQAAPALEIFEELRRDPSHASEALHFGAVLGSSAAQSALNGSDAADTVLEKFIRDDPDSRFLEDAFRQLDVVYAQQANPSESELRKWVEKPPPRRAALALYYLARAQGRARRPDLAARTLDQFVQNYPGNPLNAEANLMRTDLFLQRGDLPGAVRALDAAMRHAGSDSQRAEIEMRTGLVQDRQNEALLAHDSFWRAAKWPGRLRVDATYDAALEALRMKNYERFFADFRALRAEFHDTPLLSDLELEEGLAQARAGDARAADTLELFLRHYPKHPRQSEARLALADLAYFRGDSAGASRLLKVANESAPTPATSESAAYLAIFLADKKTPRGDEQVIELGDRFLQEYPHSAREPEVRMKLGQVHFRNNHYPNAETEFTVLAHENPSGPYAEPALFLAGRSAMKTLNPGSIDRALTLFDDVVKRDGPLKLYALQQQASIKHSLGNEGETIAIYDNILAAQPPPEPELRFASLCGKGDSLMILGRGEPALLETAIGVFDILAALPDVTPEWRNQALYKKGKALEQLSRRSEAITAYYDVLDKSGTDGREFFWYYKAGFDAATLFTQQNQWKSAIGIYEKIARVEGPRAAEARALAKKIRLERFIWD